jgi:hypothetical protein
MKPAAIKATILSVAIAIVTILFVVVAIQAIYPAPEYTDYCEEKLTFKAIEDANECEAIGGKWQEQPARAEPIKAVGWCDQDFTCRQEWDEVSEVYERNVFFANLIIGIIILVTGFFLALPAVSSGLMGAGIILIIYGTMRYWGNLSDIWRTLVLGISLAILVWLGYKKLQ